MQIKWLSLIGILCWSLSAHAIQIKPAPDNQTLTVKIAAKELSRLYVKDDRIFQVRGNEGTYHLEKDERDGAIFIRPQSIQETKPFSLFLTTEQGRTYPLLLIPVDVPSESIILKPTTPSKTIASRWETSTPYTQTVIKLITAMVNQTTPTGYAVTSTEKEKPFTMGKLKLQPLSRYQGAKFQGEILTLINTGEKMLTIKPQDFYQAGIRAIALKNDQISPNHKTFLYRVVSNDE